MSVVRVASGRRLYAKRGGVVRQVWPPTSPAGPGPTVAELLARANKVTPVGTFTTTWAEDSPTNDRTYDLRGGIFQGFFWADAIFGFGTYGGTPAPVGTHERNSFPVDIGDNNPAVGAAIIGGVVTGDQPPTLTWNSMKHGSHIQVALDSGSTGAEAWSLIVSNQNMDGDPRIHITPDSFAVVDGLRTQHTHDGFGLFGGNDNSRSDYGIAYFRNCWFSEVHDDAIENDRQREISVYDCLFERVHCFLSTQSSDTSGTPQLTKPQTITNSIVSLHPRPGPYQQPTSVVKHGNIYKDQVNSPPLVMTNVVIGCSAFNSGSQSALPTFTGCSYTNVTIVWTGAGAYPGNVPAGVTVTTDAAVLTSAIATWKTRHGVTSFTTVDMVKMLAPT